MSTMGLLTGSIDIMKARIMGKASPRGMCILHATARQRIRAITVGAIATQGKDQWLVIIRDPSSIRGVFGMNSGARIGTRSIMAIADIKVSVTTRLRVATSKLTDEDNTGLRSVLSNLFMTCRIPCTLATDSN